MKKYFIYFSAAIAVLASCAKEVDTQKEVKPEVNGTTVYITAVANQTKTTESGAIFSWTANETISVGTSDCEYVDFTINDVENGIFAHSFTSDVPDLLLAVSPAQPDGPTFVDSDMYEVCLPAVYDNYVPADGITNALMVGTPDPQDDHRFLFYHAAALVKVSYANVPVGTKSFVLETPNDFITGVYELTGTAKNEIEITNENDGNEGNKVTIYLDETVSAVNSTLSFYVPVPTGTYHAENASPSMKIYLQNAAGEKFAYSEKNLKKDITLNRGDVFTFPTVTLDPYEGEWILTGVKNNQVYACGKYTTGNNIQNVVAITVDTENKSIDEVDGIEDCKITITKAENGYYTIQDSNDSNNYWYAAGTGTNNYLKAAALEETNDKFYWTISEDSAGNHVIKANSNNRNTIKFNTNGTGTIFSCYQENGNQAPVTLYPYSWVNTTDWVLSSIAVTHAPDKTEYEAGEDFNPAGMVVTATYVDADDTEHTKPVVLDNNDLSIEPSTNLEEGTTSVTISYGGKSTTQAITVSAPIAWTLSGIAVKTAPTKVSYTVGEYFNPAGLVITATYTATGQSVKIEDVVYSDGNATEFTFAPATTTALTKADTSVSITWGGQSTSQAITVNEASATKTYTLTITSDDLVVLDSSQSSTYNKYKGDQTFTAVASDNSVISVVVNITDVMPGTGANSGKLQIKKSSGLLYNKTDLGSITSISAGDLTQTIGSTQNPSTVSANGGYFKLVNSTSGAVYLSSITISFTK